MTIENPTTGESVDVTPAYAEWYLRDHPGWRRARPRTRRALRAMASIARHAPSDGFEDDHMLTIRVSAGDLRAIRDEVACQPKKSAAAQNISVAGPAGDKATGASGG